MPLLHTEILAYLLSHNLIDGTGLTVTGRTLGENLERWTYKYGGLPAGQDIIRPLDNPIKASGHIRFVLSFPTSLLDCRPYTHQHRILRGNLAPGGAVAKITGKEGLGFTGRARTFDSEEALVSAVEKGEIRKGEKTVVVLRYLGPRGGPGACLSLPFLSFGFEIMLCFGMAC
jgi:dihydroxy-acid dehydratase